MMALGAVQSGYAGAAYAYRRTTSVTEEFYSDISSAVQMTEDGGKSNGKVIGHTTIPNGGANESYGMKVQYAEESTPEFYHYELNVPRNVLKAWLETAEESGANELDNDMFTHMTSVMIRRFSKYQDEDAAGNPIEAALKAAEEGLHTYELEKERAFYQAFIGKLEKLQEGQDGAEDKANNEEAEEVVDFMQFIRKRMEEIFVLIQNGDTETSFQIGSSSFTIKEWEEFLKKFDDIEDAIKELMREEIEKRTGKAEEKKAVEAAAEAEGINALVSESTQCTYPSYVPGQEDTVYITWYTEEGIFCRKAGQNQGYEWSVYFENKEDYHRVMEFLDRFDREDNLRFAAHENFWQDFLNDEIDLDSFMKFYAGTDHGVPDYTVSAGDSMYVDRDKIQWAKYMNSPGTKLYTREEMMKMQEELIAANKVKLTKLADPYSRIYQKTHPKYNGESIFCEYPGGTLYTADEIAEKMMRNLFDRQYLAKWI